MMRKVRSRIKGGALPYAILVMVLIITFCGLLIGIFFFYDQYFNNEVIRVKLNDNISSASTLLLNNDKLFETNDTISIILFNDSTNKVSVIRKEWGGYEVYLLESNYVNNKEMKSILVGMSFNKNMPALYLPDKNNYLYAVGKTVLKGKLYVPGGIIKQGLISGRGYDNNLTIEGQLLNSKQDLPAITIRKVTSLKNESENSIQNDSVTLFSDKSIIEYKNSFTKRPLKFVSNEEIILNNCKLSGNIKVYSGKKIEIGENTELDGIIVSAPFVSVNDKFKGAIQIIATDSINIGKDCNFKYPSFICLVGDSSKTIKIDRNTNIHGGVALITKNARGLIIIEKDVIVRGMLYSQQSIDIKGKILGVVFSNNISYNYRSSLYPNYFSDCEINSLDVPEFFVFPLILNDYHSKGIISWHN